MDDIPEVANVDLILFIILFIIVISKVMLPSEVAAASGTGSLALFLAILK